MQKPFSTAFAEMKAAFHKLSYRHSYSNTFTYFLDYALYMLDPKKDPTPAEYLNSVFDEKEEKHIEEMFWAWADASDNEGEGFTDVLGEIFMEFVSHGRNGQYFTPQPICDMMALMTIDEDRKTVSDPACGSGRTLLAAAKINRRMFFFGADNDLTCCKMAALNMIVNSMQGEIAHMNSLSLEYYSSFQIRVVNHQGMMIPVYNRSTDRNQSAFFK